MQCKKQKHFMEYRKIILTRGIQGSGKSTWAKAWVEEDPTNRIRFNNDDIRFMQGPYMPVDNKTACNKYENVVKFIKENFIIYAMGMHYNIVADNMNFSEKEWKFYDKLIEEFNANHTDIKYTREFKDFFDISVDECIRRDAMREHPIGAKVIKDTFKRNIKIILSNKMRNYVNSLNKNDGSKDNCILVDIDSTLCFNTSGRMFFGTDEAELILTDTPCWQTIYLVQKFIDDMQCKVFFITGRMNIPIIKENTLKWLNTYFNGGITEDMLIMRSKDNYTSTDVCKKDLYETHIKGKYNVIFVIDDTQKVVDMWRKEGLVCLQPNNGTL